MALQAQDDKKREERENFLITTIPITIQAAHEPSLYHTSEEHEEGIEICLIRKLILKYLHYVIYLLVLAPPILIFLVLKVKQICM